MPRVGLPLALGLGFGIGFGIGLGLGKRGITQGCLALPHPSHPTVQSLVFDQDSDGSIDSEEFFFLVEVGSTSTVGSVL